MEQLDNVGTEEFDEPQPDIPFKDRFTIRLHSLIDEYNWGIDLLPCLHFVNVKPLRYRVLTIGWLTKQVTISWDY